MIRFENVTKTFVMDGKRKTVMENVSMTFPDGRSVGLLGRNGAGKSTLLQMIAGTMPPTSGKIVTTGRISFPVGFAGSFHGELSGAQNCRFVARIYGVDTDELIAFVGERIASYKKPRQVIFLEAVPKTAVGKINRKAVRDQLNA